MAVDEWLPQVARIEIDEQGSEDECDDAFRDYYKSSNICWNLDWTNRGILFAFVTPALELALGALKKIFIPVQVVLGYENLLMRSTECYYQYKAELYTLENKKYDLLFQDYKALRN